MWMSPVGDGHDLRVYEHSFKSIELSLWDKPLVFYGLNKNIIGVIFQRE
jgi:hypothetical protein